MRFICAHVLERTREDPSITDPTERARLSPELGAGVFHRHGVTERAVLYVCRKDAGDEG
jgi:hypothetical protein